MTPGLRPVMEIAGVDQELIDWSSTHRPAIEDVLEGITDDYVKKHGYLPGERARHGLAWWAAQETRPDKKTPRPLDQLLAWWCVSALLKFGQRMVDGLLQRCQAAGAAIRARVGPWVDTARLRAPYREAQGVPELLHPIARFLNQERLWSSRSRRPPPVTWSEGWGTSGYSCARASLTTVLIPDEEFEPGGAANGRALAWLVASLGVGVADGVGDLGLGHAGGCGDDEVAGELCDEGFRGGAGRDQTHILSDANGLPLLVGVSAANTHDSEGLKPRWWRVTKRDTTPTAAVTSSPSGWMRTEPTTALICVDGSVGSVSAYASPARASSSASG